MTTNECVTGRIEDWSIDPYHDVVWGNVYNDIRKRFSDGTWIHTSLIPGLNREELKEGMEIKTLNSIYLLGKKHE